MITARAVALGVVLLLGSAACAAGPGPVGRALSPSPSPSIGDAALYSEAADACEGGVKDRLKSPASAEFPAAETEVRWTLDSEDTWQYEVSGSVDSQNGFGAMIRSTYVCEVAYTPRNGTWDVLDVLVF